MCSSAASRPKPNSTSIFLASLAAKLVWARRGIAAPPPRHEGLGLCGGCSASAKVSFLPYLRYASLASLQVGTGLVSELEGDTTDVVKNRRYEREVKKSCQTEVRGRGRVRGVG